MHGRPAHRGIISGASSWCRSGRRRSDASSGGSGPGGRAPGLLHGVDRRLARACICIACPRAAVLALHTLGWAVGSLEVVLTLAGVPVSHHRALVLRRSAAPLGSRPSVPGSLGALQGNVAIFVAFGLPGRRACPSPSSVAPRARPDTGGARAPDDVRGGPPMGAHHASIGATRHPSFPVRGEYASEVPRRNASHLGPSRRRR
jgi:hypothetical protein